MKRPLVFLVLSALILSLSFAAVVPTDRGEGIFSSFTAKDLDGKTYDESVFKGKKLTMVNIWATFCSPCIREMPYIAKLAEKYADQGFQVVGIISDINEMLNKANTKRRDTAHEIITTTGADYLHLISSKSLEKAHLSEVMYVPETIFVTEDGRQIGQSYTGSMTEAQWEEVIIALLKAVQ